MPCVTGMGIGRPGACASGMALIHGNPLSMEARGCIEADVFDVAGLVEAHQSLTVGFNLGI